RHFKSFFVENFVLARRLRKNEAAKVLNAQHCPPLFSRPARQGNPTDDRPSTSCPTAAHLRSRLRRNPHTVRAGSRSASAAGRRDRGRHRAADGVDVRGNAGATGAGGRIITLPMGQEGGVSIWRQ